MRLLSLALALTAGEPEELRLRMLLLLTEELPELLTDLLELALTPALPEPELLSVCTGLKELLRVLCIEATLRALKLGPAEELPSRVAGPLSVAAALAPLLLLRLGRALALPDCRVLPLKLAAEEALCAEEELAMLLEQEEALAPAL